MKLGIVGLPNVGKSTLFNALTGASANVDVYPFTTVDPNVGVVAVPDTRLEELGALLRPKKLTPARVEFIDIAGLVEGASRGEGLGNQFLAKVREVDGIVHVVRSFEEGISHVSGSVDPARDMEIIRTEMAIADLEVLQRRIEKLKGAVRRGDKSEVQEKEAMEEIQGLLSDLDLSDLRRWIGERGIPPGCESLLSIKPVMYVVNISDEWASEPDSAPGVGPVIEMVEGEGPVIPMAVRLEGELSAMSRQEEEAFRAEFNMESRPINRLIREGSRLLGLITFYTVKGEETRGWMVKDGTTMVEAAGTIHSDMERGFIKAEVVPCRELFSQGSMTKARESGKVAVEGREYRVRDGDVVLIRFRV